MRSWWWVKEKKMQMGLVFIIVTMVLQFQMKGCVGCVETERNGLLQLKSYLNSLRSYDELTVLKSWSDDDPKSDCCNWEGVKCSDAISGYIVDLTLDLMYTSILNQTRGLNLSLLHSFPQLKSFSFSTNFFCRLFDPIHGYKSFERLENLDSLDLSGNHFNDTVLPFLSASRSLRNLKLDYNRLEGVFPPNGFRELKFLDLSNNKLNGFEASDGLRKMKLKTLLLSGNRFSDTAQLKGLEHLVELENLDLSNNNLNDFEASDGLRMRKLKTLLLSGNRFSDTARLKGLEHLVELEGLSLGKNKFNNTRSIQVLKNMTKLQQLGLSGNEFTDLDSLGSVLPSSLQLLTLKDNQLSLTQEGYSKLCGLINLRELDLSNNTLTSMPYCLGNVSRLRTLELSNNHLNGNLSAFVFGLPPEIEYLSLLDNNFNGSFLFNSLINHTKLTVFKLSSKVGNIIQAQAESSSWVPLFQLKKLRLHNFNLGNTIPSFLVHQHDLSYVDLSHNKLTTGPFARWLVQNNTRLQSLFLNNNLLTELQLPRLAHDGLQFLDISSNRIYGSIQEDIGIVFPKMRFKNFSSNQFHGTIPSSMGEMKDLVWLDMSSNGLSGQLPKLFMSGCYSLETLKLSNNKFQGKIFPEHANLTSLGALYLDGNNFTGSIGEGFLNSKNLWVLDLSDNSFSGTVPLWMSGMLRLAYLYMSGNQLKGLFPRQLLSQKLSILDMSRNSFSGAIPRDLDFSSLRELRLQNNDFVGSIPSTLFEAESLQVLDLRNNNFSGKFPDTVGKRSSRLRVLLLRNNKLQSHIPEKICQLISDIGLLDLSHNKFNGVIPSCLGNMSFGADMYEDTDGSSWESLFVMIQSPFSPNWSYTSALNLISDLQSRFDLHVPTVVDFLTKSRYEAYQGDILRYMYGLDLSSNRLTGEIPVEIGDLENIRSLNFSRNRLTGSIPYNISKLKNLGSLDLSNNKLYGNIPSVLADLNTLGYFDVSFNNLSGEIPFKGHLATFDEKSYIGNAHLCGLPTNISCNPTRVPEESANEEEEDDNAIDMEWFFWTCGAVYISTFLALFAFLCIDTRWSQEWFYLVDLFIHHFQCYMPSAFNN